MHFLVTEEGCGLGWGGCASDVLVYRGKVDGWLISAGIIWVRDLAVLFGMRILEVWMAISVEKG